MNLDKLRPIRAAGLQRENESRESPRNDNCAPRLPPPPPPFNEKSCYPQRYLRVFCNRWKSLDHVEFRHLATVSFRELKKFQILTGER